MLKTKLVFTIGPASDKEEVLEKLIQAGMSATRHNFSHGDHEEHRIRIELVKKLREKHNKSIAIILDTKGPEIRCGVFKDDKVELKENDDFVVNCGEDILGDVKSCTISYKELYQDVAKDAKIMINDGLVALNVEKVEGKKIYCRVLNTGVIGSRKNINIIGANVKLPALTDKDIDDLKFGCEVGVDFIAASFIRKAKDVAAIRKVLNQYGGERIGIISKIENDEGVNNIDEIIKLSDAVMVARGDLGVAIPTEQVPLVQKMIIRKCNIAGKPVITATQMLDSMQYNPRPTRAEASDVANAIFDGTDAVMLSGETANGKYPFEAASTMAQIALAAENGIDYSISFRKQNNFHAVNVAEAISASACTTALELNASAIITATQSGNTARLVAKHRPGCPIIAATPYKGVALSLALNFGVMPIETKKFSTTDELVEESVKTAIKTNYVNKGDLVVIAAGVPVSSSGTTNMIKVQIVGDTLIEGKGAGSIPAFGTCRIINNPREALDKVQMGDILVIKNLDREYMKVLDKVSGIISEEGGLTSHLAIECIVNEIPLITSADNATNILKNGSYITMDTPTGSVISGKFGQNE